MQSAPALAPTIPIRLIVIGQCSFGLSIPQHPCTTMYPVLSVVPRPGLGSGFCYFRVRVRVRATGASYQVKGDQSLFRLGLGSKPGLGLGREVNYCSSAGFACNHLKARGACGYTSGEGDAGYARAEGDAGYAGADMMVMLGMLELRVMLGILELRVMLGILELRVMLGMQLQQ